MRDDSCTESVEILEPQGSKKCLVDVRFGLQSEPKQLIYPATFKLFKATRSYC